MTRDNRLYDIVTALATNNPTDAVESFKSILGERIESNISSMTTSYSYSNAGPIANDSTD